MKNSTRLFPVSLITLALLLAMWFGSESTGWSAVTFSITPAAVSNTYDGTISFSINGLTNGETVVVQKFLDANTNGAIDAGDLLIQHLKLTDGTNFVIGGVTNFNVPGDLNTATGAITANLNFQNGDFSQNIIGKYLYKLSSPVGHFAPITNLFTVTNFPFAQKVTGNVVSNGTSTAVANAVVLLFPPPRAGSHGPGTPVAAAVANNSGVYSIPVSPGTYVPLAFRSNFVANYSTAPVITLGSSATISTNLTLTNATAAISGQFLDASDATKGLPAIFTPVEAAINGQEFIAVGFSDTNGDFTIGVTSGQWSVGDDDSGLIVHGYVGYQQSTKVNAGSTGVNLAYPKATALFYGRVTDGSGNPLANIDIGGSDNNDGLYQADGFTDSNGDYVVGVVGGLGASDPWQAQVGDNSTADIFSQPDFDQNGGTNISAGQAVPADFTGLPSTNYISGNVQFNGTNVVGVGVSAYATINGLNYSVNTVDTDGNGNYTLAVANGVWSVNLNCQGNNDSLDNLLGSGNYECPDNQNVTINGGNGTANFIVQANNGIQITTASLPAAQVGAYYYSYLQGSTGNGTQIWTLIDPQDFPSTLTLNSDGEIFGTPETAGTYNFTVQLSDGDDNSATQPLSLTINPKLFLGKASWQTNRFEMLLTGASNQNYTVQTSTNLSSPNWISLFTTNSATANSFIIIDPAATNSTRFYRVLIGP